MSGSTARPCRLLAIALLTVVVTVADGCGAAQMPMQQSATLVSGKVKVGMMRGDVVFILGRPQSTENVGQVEFLFYTPIWYALHLAPSQSPIAIREGKVVGIGKAYYDETAQGLNVAQASK